MRSSSRVAEVIYGTLLVLVVAGIVWIIRLPRTDVDICRTVFRGLAAGKASVAQRIEWASLRALDVDVGRTYRELTTDHDRAAYRREFVRSFAVGFRSVNAAPRDFVNWRVAERAPEQVIVATDYRGKGKTLWMTLSTSGQKRVQAIVWAPDAAAPTPATP